MSKQWGMVLAIVAGLVIGAAALVRFGPKIEGVEVDKRAPNFTAARVPSGDSVSIESLSKGKVTLVNIWATWCIPCREEMPAMQRLFEAMGPKGFRIVAISIDTGDPSVVQQFTSELGLTFDILQDRSGEIQRVYQTTGVPESFLLDRNGVIVKKALANYPWDSPSIRTLVETLLGAN